MKSIDFSKISLILTDPPYGITGTVNDSCLNIAEMFNTIQITGNYKKTILLFSVQPFTTQLIVANLTYYKYELIWVKNVPTGMAQAAYSPMKYHETIQVFSRTKINPYNKQPQKREGKGKACYKYHHYCGESNHVKMDKVKKMYNEKLVNPSSVLFFNTVPNRNGRLHPLQKPVPLLEYLILTYSNPGDTVLDFTCGSGSTGEACLNTNRNFIGIELNKNHIERAEKRLASVRLQNLQAGERPY
jgi:site-specific DNA-methyltransferase (adenine-specific)